MTGSRRWPWHCAMAWCGDRPGWPPPPVTLISVNVAHAGREERRPVRRVALGSLGVAVILVIAKLGAAVATGSLSLLSDAAHAGLDAVVTAMTLYAISVASRPPDADHPYGHGKAENVAALVQAFCLLALSVAIGREAIQRLSHHPGHVQATWYAFAVVAGSIVVDATRARLLGRAARRYASPALEADALNFRADLATSAAVLAGLLAVKAGHPGADTYGGLAIATYVCFCSARLGRRSIDALMDRAPEDAVGRIRRVAAGITGVEEVRRVRLRYAGGQPHADVVVGVSRTVPLEVAHSLTEQVEQAIRAVEPGADVVVHVEPLADETVVAQQVLSVAARHPRAQQVHNVFVARQPDGLHIALHAKFPGTMTLVEAHGLAEQLEADIAAEVGGVARVDTHLEPLEGVAMVGQDVTSVRGELVRSVTALAERQDEVRNCHEVVVTDTDGGLSVVMHCEAAAVLSVARVHDTSTVIENEIHRAWPEVQRTRERPTRSAR
jgi:cation diffusion facilitator family transporter